MKSSIVLALALAQAAASVPVGIEKSPVHFWSEEVHGDPRSLWIRLRFDELELGPTDRIRITSLSDAFTQNLDAVSAKQWGHTSAIFNGNQVQVDVLGFGRTAPSVHVGEIMTHPLDEVTDDVSPIHEESICYAPDTRDFSFDFRQGRYVYGTNDKCCTAWQIDDEYSCYLSAGHCSDNGDGLVEYFVPLSDEEDGILQHPPPMHQYPVDQASMQTAYPASDWRYFGVFPNSETGLLPSEAYGGGVYELVKPEDGIVGIEPGTPMEIIGYGESESFPNSHRRVQKQAEGPYHSGTLDAFPRYRVDTSNGNSGSAIFDKSLQKAIGVHTNGGCRTTDDNSSNYGVGILTESLQNALNHPLGVCATGVPRSERPATYQPVN